MLSAITLLVLIQSAASIALERGDTFEIDFDSINPGMELAAAETLASVEFEEIDLNKIDIIEANKQDTVRVPIRQLRELLQLAIKEDRFRQTLEKKMNRPRASRRRGHSSRPRSSRPVDSKILPIKFDLRSDIHIE